MKLVSCFGVLFNRVHYIVVLEKPHVLCYNCCNIYRKDKKYGIHKTYTD